MSTSTLRDTKYAELATKHRQVNVAHHGGACAVLTNDRAEGE